MTGRSHLTFLEIVVLCFLVVTVAFVVGTLL